MDSGSTAAAAAAAVASGDAKGLDKNTLVAVLQFLNKNSLQVSACLVFYKVTQPLKHKIERVYLLMYCVHCGMFSLFNLCSVVNQ